MNKICKDCNVDKDINEYSKQKGGKDGYKTICKKCYYIRYGAKIKEYTKNNQEQRKNTNKKYRDNNKDKLNEYNKLYAEQNKDIIKEKSKKYRDNNKDKLKKYAADTKDRRKEYKKNYYQLNKKWINKNNKEYQNKYVKNRRKTDIKYKLMCNIRALIKMYVRKKGYKKNTKTEHILCCSYEEFKEYIISQFEPWMTLENYGIYTGNYNETWQIDHIQPISNACNEDEVIKLNHYTNLRPLCSRKNLEKSNK